MIKKLTSIRNAVCKECGTKIEMNGIYFEYDNGVLLCPRCRNVN